MPESLEDTLAPRKDRQGSSSSVRAAGMAGVLLASVFLGVFFSLSSHGMSPLFAAGDERLVSLYGHECTVESLYRPSSEAEIVDIVRHASRMRKKVTVVGGGTSFSSSLCSEGESNVNMVSLERYDAVLDIDPVAKTVTVQSGITASDLHAQLLSHGLALDALPNIERATIGGLVSVGAHTTGGKPLCDSILSVSAVNSKGKVITSKRATSRADDEEESSDADMEVLAALGLGVGASGVLTEITFRCSDTRRFLRTDRTLPLSEVDFSTGGLQRIEWVPYTSSALVTSWIPTDNDLSVGAWHALSSQWFAFKLRLRTLAFVAGGWLPMLAPTLNAIVPTGYRPRFTAVDYVSLAPAPAQRESFVMEVYVGHERAAEAFRLLRQMLEHIDVAVNAVVRIRFAEPSLYALSPLFDRRSVGFELSLVAQSERTGAKFANMVMKRLRAAQLAPRFHWGKALPSLMDKAFLEESYPQFGAFRAARRRLDQESTFLTVFGERYFAFTSGDMQAIDERLRAENDARVASEEAEKQALRAEEEATKSAKRGRKELMQEEARKRHEEARSRKQADQKAREAQQFQKALLQQQQEETSKQAAEHHKVQQAARRQQDELKTRQEQANKKNAEAKQKQAMAMRRQKELEADEAKARAEQTVKQTQKKNQEKDQKRATAAAKARHAKTVQKTQERVEKQKAAQKLAQAKAARVKEQAARKAQIVAAHDKHKANANLAQGKENTVKHQQQAAPTPYRKYR